MGGMMSFRRWIFCGHRAMPTVCGSSSWTTGMNGSCPCDLRCSRGRIATSFASKRTAADRRPISRGWTSPGRTTPNLRMSGFLTTTRSRMPVRSRRWSRRWSGLSRRIRARRASARPSSARKTVIESSSAARRSVRSWGMPFRSLRAVGCQPSVIVPFPSTTRRRVRFLSTWPPWRRAVSGRTCSSSLDGRPSRVRSREGRTVGLLLRQPEHAVAGFQIRVAPRRRRTVQGRSQEPPRAPRGPSPRTHPVSPAGPCRFQGRHPPHARGSYCCRGKNLRFRKRMIFVGQCWDSVWRTGSSA